MNIKKSKIIIALVLLVAITGAAFGFSQANKDKPQQPAASQRQPQEFKPVDKPIEYKGSEGKNALELLKQAHTIETKSYEGLGELVTAIDGKAAASNQFWAFYINGQQSQVGASAYITKNGDTIVWKLEEIK